MYNRHITVKQDTLEDGSSNLTLYFFPCQHPIIFSSHYLQLYLYSRCCLHTNSALSSCYHLYRSQSRIPCSCKDPVDCSLPYSLSLIRVPRHVFIYTVETVSCARRQRVRYVTSSRGCDYRDCVTPFLEGTRRQQFIGFPRLATEGIELVA